MVFLKNNTGGESSQQKKSSNLKPQTANDQVLNNRLPKKDINMLTTAKQTTTTATASANCVANSESQQPKANKKPGEDEVKRDNHSAASESSSKVGVESANPFTVKLEINIVVVALFAVALGLRLYAIDQPNSVV